MIRQALSAAAQAQQHLQALHVGSEVTRWFRQDREPQVVAVTPERVLAALHEAGIHPVLMGTHGLNGYRDEARATQDVVVLVTKKNVRKAVRALEKAFPYLEVFENASVARFLDPVSQKGVIDVMKPNSQAMQVVFRHTIAVGDTHRIPDLEMGLVSKFVAMASPNRSKPKRMQDVADFAAIVTYNKDALDLEKLRRLAAKVYPNGGAKIVALAQDLWAGREIHF